MDVTELRARQAPLKQRYRDDPASAATQVGAEASWSEPGITTTVESWAGSVRAGLHTATGGDGDDACSADMLMQALLGCAGVTMRSVATAMRLEVRSARLRAESTFDARGTLGLSRDVPVGISAVRISAVLDTDADDESLAKLAELTERYCVVARSLSVPVEIAITR
jgi:uncharacterized OsmC-like protein